MLKATHPSAVLVHNTYDHRRVVKSRAARVPVMMEKPPAVSVEDARAIKSGARGQDSGFGEL
jgi:predicted dehydrogenase